MAAAPPTAELTRAVVPTMTSVPPSATLPPSPTPRPQDTSTPPPAATLTETPIPETPVDAIQLIPVIENAFTRPLYVTHAGDERLFVVEQSGRIQIVTDGQLAPLPFLDITDRVGSSQLEQGLLGLAFHPDYANNGAFFVNYTDLSGSTQIARYETSAEDPDRANPDSEVILLSLNQPYPNHNGGQVAFGPDGYLYVGVGDGGSANDPLNSGQDPSTLLGTLLRLDVDNIPGQAGIPGDNPFVSNDDRRNEIWAWGLRNPWRFSFDRLTGDLFIADVGQNLWEEINLEPAGSPGGLNYGWNIMEGNHCFNAQECSTEGLELPIFEYPHAEGCSVTGGYVYRGEQFLELYGNYFLGDFCQGTIWRLFPAGDGSWASAVVLDTNHVISSFGEDAQGELYLTDHTTGSLYQLQP
jgi:glucose/arabinose dehydrogenase